MNDIREQSPSRHKRVLVVDDDAAIRSMIVAVLSRDGYDVGEAFGGAEALEQIAWDGYDAIVLDLMMPVVSGFDVLRAISQVRPNSRCVIAMSAASPQLLDAIDTTLVRTRLQKPFDIQKLLAAVRSCSDGRS